MISKTQATMAIDTAVDSITSALRKGDRVALIGFGTFGVVRQVHELYAPGWPGGVSPEDPELVCFQ